MKKNFTKWLLVICSGFVMLSGYAQSIQKSDSLEVVLKITKNANEKIDILLKLSDELRNNNPDKALNYANNAYNLSKESGDRQGILKSLISLSQINWSKTNFKAAMKYAEEAINLAEKLNMNQELAFAYRITGLIYIELNNYEKSSEYFFKSLRIFEQQNDKEGILKLLSDIGSVNFYQYNYKKAIEYYFKSLNIAKEINNQKGIARGLNNLAAVYEAMQDYEKAGDFFHKASIINRKLENKLWEGINYMNIGTINMNLNKNKAALEYFNKALLIFTDLQNIILQLKCQLNLANYYSKTNNTELSLKYAQNALTKGQEKDLKQIVFDAAIILHKIYLQKGDIDKAYEYLIIQYQTRDSLYLMQNKAELAKLELQYDFDKKEQAKQIEQQRKDLITLFIIISLLIALIIIILILARLRVKAKNALLEQQKLEHELEIKNKELTTNVMSLMKKNEVLSVISEKLIDIKNQAVKDETKKAINRISKEINKITNEEVTQEFELRFNQVHSDFYEKLLLRFPDLTPNEQRLCAFLKLNMTTKEISELTGQRPTSLETARYRLRKKLGISNSQTNLITFLSKI